MPLTRQVTLNGKFLSAAPTGVHRVAAELGNALADLIAEGHDDARNLALRVLAPSNGMSRASELRMPAAHLGPLTGIPWEQLTLPLRSDDSLLLNLCNIGPMLARNAVTMIHDVQVLLSPSSYQPAFRAWYRLVQPVIARRHRHILTVSEFSRGEIVRAGLCPPAKVSVVHNGVDHILRETCDNSALRQLGLEAHGFVVALANIQAHKNIAVLMQAFSRPELASIKLVLFGSASRADFEAAGIAVPANAVFAGRISDGQLRGLLEQALCLAFPSTTEGFGLPPLEAMLLGCPVIAAPCGALPEVCGSAAIFAAPHAPEEWSAPIVSLLRDPGLRKCTAASGQHHAAKFTWRHSALELVRVLSRI